MFPFEGGFASFNPRASVCAGSFAFRAGNDGLAIGRFGWGDANTGLASNVRTAADQVLGLVAPFINGNMAAFPHRGRLYIRPGLGITLFAKGDFWARFRNGAYAGQPVYASLLDGSVISGYSADAELTPWTVVNNCGPGQLTIISTWSKVST